MSRERAPAELLICPACASTYGESERFCHQCHLPLVLAGEGGLQAVGDRHARARKIKPQLAEGSLVRVAGGRNQAEAEFIQALLLEEGVPSLLRRSAGFDVPDFLAAGPRDVLVPQAGLTVARQVLLQAELVDEQPAGLAVRPLRLLLVLIVAMVVGVIVVWLVSRAV
jgi:hypothetical protein